MVLTIRQLAARAKMNFLPEDDWQIFMAQIEAGIRQFMQEYIRDWQRIEEYVTSIVMKHKGRLCA